ncbi:MAG: hypothetical protein BKP49_07685 [Treponema sp. CETP13]|nr:MAG: hypothetical protein BKP49_07685 [Treponema sp. CETP13]
MNKYQIRKFFGLFVLYGLLFLGIFMVQFRNESSISKKFGDIKLHLSETLTKENETLLKNNFQVSTRGITLFSNDINPVKLTYVNGNVSTLKIVNWTQDSDSSFTIDFSEDTHLSFSSSTSDHEILSISAKLPNNAHRITISYKLGGAYTVTDYKASYALINSQKNDYILKAQNITANTISLTNPMNIAMFGDFIKSETFSFDDILDYPQATDKAREASIEKLRTTILATYPVQKDTITSEIAIAAWIAEKSRQGDYQEAIDTVPQTFKDSSTRTYLTTTYFNTLQEMNKSLDMQIENISFSMQNSISKKSLDVFELDSFPDFLLTKTTASINKILAVPSNMGNFAPTVSQAAGILHVYNELKTKKPESIALLENVLQLCVEKIESNCIPTNTLLTIVENDEKVNTLITLKAGYELLRLGQIKQQTRLIAAGNLLINSVLTTSINPSMRTLGEEYKILCASTNPYYPHIQVLKETDTDIIWAWTCAQKLTYNDETNDIHTIDCTFPKGTSHYMIMHGIKQFSSIEIYGLKYRTDPRFEWYNSSGYAVDTEKDILFLKFRQKADTEKVRLFY